MGCHCAEISAQFCIVCDQLRVPPKRFCLLMGKMATQVPEGWRTSVIPVLAPEGWRLLWAKWGVEAHHRGNIFLAWEYHQIAWESTFRLRGSQRGEDWLSVWWKFTIIMKKRSPGTRLVCLERSVRAHQQKWHIELLNGRVPGRQRQSSTAQITESIITYAGDSLATPNSNILLASQGVQAWNNSRALRTYKS